MQREVLAKIIPLVQRALLHLSVSQRLYMEKVPDKVYHIIPEPIFPGG